MGGGLVRSAVAALLVSASTVAFASDTLKYGPQPSWVIPAKMPTSTKSPSDAPTAFLLNDQQIFFEKGKSTTFSEFAIKIQTAAGLSAGNITIPWNPAFQEITVHKLTILRGDQVIDVLDDQKFTTIRRESNLEAAMLDGRLTAILQPEGLQEGDILSFAASVEHADPATKGHVEASFAAWNDVQIGLGQARLIWPADMNLRIRQSGGLPEPTTSTVDGRKVATFSLRAIDPMIPPKGAPSRFQLGRNAEASDFGRWSDVAATMIPHYEKASVIPATGPLRDEVERIRKASADPVARTEMALSLVQDRVRYVALLMGEGGVVPASAESTWSQRLGDCKAKTALLIAILREFGIEASPVLVHSSLGDALPERLPMLGLFDHVIVRATVAGKVYWLDGTRRGDARLDRIQVPSFRWGLPLVANAELIPINPAAMAVPGEEQYIEVDASGGIFAPAPVLIRHVFRGDLAVALNHLYSQATTDQRTEVFRNIAKGLFSGMTVKSTSFQFDKTSGELHQKIEGEAKIDWKNGWYFVPSSTVGYKPDFERPAGPQKEAPFAVNYPKYEVRRTTIRLPSGFISAQNEPLAIEKQILAGFEYQRNVDIKGDVITVETRERSIAPEVAYAEAVAASGRLKELYDADIHLKVPGHYRPTLKDAQAFIASRPTTAAEYLRRGKVLLDQQRFDEAIADFNEVLRLEPLNHDALSGRVMGHIWKKDFDAAERDLAAIPSSPIKQIFEYGARGLIAEQKGEYETAVAQYSKAHEAQPKVPLPLGRRAIVQNKLNKPEEALADAAEALALAPAWADLRLLRANIFVKMAKRAEAAEEARLLMSQNPASDYGHVAAANILARVGRQEEAMDAFAKALAIKPLSYIYLNRALARPASDKKGRIADFDEAIKLDPKDVYARTEKAKYLAMDGHLAEALKELEHAAENEPDDLQLGLSRATTLHRLGRTAEAEKLFASLRTKAKTAEELNNVCWEKATHGILLETALSDCQDALKQEPANGNALDSLGMVLLRLGKYSEALEAYTKAIAADGDAESLMGRAFVYARTGDAARAAADREAALKLDPDTETRFADYGLKM